MSFAALLGVILLAGSPVTVEAGACPSAQEIERALAPLLPSLPAGVAPDRARVVPRGIGLHVEMQSPDGAAIADRDLEPTGSCAELAQIAAVVIAAWESDVHPAFAGSPSEVAPPPAAEVEAPHTPTVEGKAAAPRSASYDVAAGAGLSFSDSTAAGVGLALTWAPRGAGLALRVGGVGETQHDTSLGQGQASSNTGQAPSGVLSLSSSNEAFVIRAGGNGNCVSGQTLAAGASCTVAIVFAPSASDDRSGTLSYSATPGGSGSIALSGSCKLGRLSVLAGVPSGQGMADGTGAAARFSYPLSAAIDQAGTLFVSDRLGFIRKITPAGVVTTPFGAVEVREIVDDTGTQARFHCPTGIAMDGTGYLYVAEHDRNAIRMITPTGVVTTLAGSGEIGVGAADGTGATARFALPSNVAADGAENVFVADVGNNAIRKITPAGVVSTFAGVLSYETQGNFPGPLPASLVEPAGVAINPSTGTLAIALVDAILTVAP